MKLGFVGVGWIGRHRMAAMLAAAPVERVLILEPDPGAQASATAAAAAAGAEAAAVGDLAALLAEAPDGVVVASPSALHADQAASALQAGAAVFCQKPLGRTEAETARVVEAARAADRLLGVDFSYRRTAAVERMSAEISSGSLGEVFALDLTFHNAYGPDKPWFYDPAQSGGGCLIDLGVHLVDLAARLTGGGAPEVRFADLRREGRPLCGRAQVEDFAAVDLRLANGALARLACSWRLAAGRDAEIRVCVYGTRGGLELCNVDGSFYDFALDRLVGSRRERLLDPPDDWGGRVAADWARALARGARFDPAITDVAITARVLDAAFAAAASAGAIDERVPA